ncbi:MAG: TIGR03960 family B12-binding radical SAM protein [Oscillospiraceae bacterium]|nr:TIGR03960 family B12-binding radical SAM protein [Oscillospiraceae bacterium]
MDIGLHQILMKVQKPARYTGGEYNQIVKDRNTVSQRIALCFPDTYEIGMSNLGMRILYGVFNECPDIWCERVFAPWRDMREQMRGRGIPLYGLESGDPISTFDIIAFSIGYEMAYTTVLDMIDLAGLPVKACDRDDSMPLICAGGTVCYNAEPMADFIDLFFIGEGEKLDLEVFRLYDECRRKGMRKTEFLKLAAGIQGVYVPSLYRVSYDGAGAVTAVTPEEGAPAVVKKRIVEDFDRSYFPARTIVPSTEIVHDRVVLELFRGCIRGCRFCQAGYVYRPVRAKKPDTLIRQGIAALSDSGYEEITLSSLSTSDYRNLFSLCDGLLDWCEPNHVSLSLPSLRADNFSVDLMERVQKVRKSGLTFAPEAGTQRLRDVINKNVREEDLLNSCRIAFEGGWNTLKLYFMLGLPTETDEDVVAIAELAERVFQVWKKSAANRNRGLRLTVSTSLFVPKPHTPFQWNGQISSEEYLRRVALLKSSLRSRAIVYNWHEAETSLVEAVLARGDRRIGGVIEKVWRKSGGLDSWSEFFSLDNWLSSMDEEGLDPAFFANRDIPEDEVLPWSMITAGVTADYLRKERRTAMEGRITPDCRKQCTGCGVNRCFSEVGCDE